MTYTIRPLLQTVSAENDARIAAGVITNRTVEFFQLVSELYESTIDPDLNSCEN